MKHYHCPNLIEHHTSHFIFLFQETSNWSCPECTLSLKMESFENQSESMKLISADEFCSLLTRTIEFLSSLPGADLFTEPVDLIEFPDYRDHIVNPVHLGQIQANINNKFYGSTESFIADIKWLYHNSIIYNGCKYAVAIFSCVLFLIFECFSLNCFYFIV